jgi:hypothetical protein
LLRASREHQRSAGSGEIRRQRQRALSLGQRAFMVTAPRQDHSETRPSFRLRAIERDRPACQQLGRAHCFGKTACLKVSRLGLSNGQAHIGSREGRVEIELRAMTNKDG